MKGKSILVVLLVVAGTSSAVLAEYQTIAHNLAEGVPDTDFVGGVLTISQAPANTLTLDDNPDLDLPYTITNAAVSLETTLFAFHPGSTPSHPSGEAEFRGGTFSLSFDYDNTTSGESGSYHINGPISGIIIGFQEYTPDFGGWSTLTGEGLWTAASVVLPGSNDWDDGGGFSSIHTLTFEIGQDLTYWEWNTDMEGGETQYNISPNDSAVPEPASVIFLALGSLCLLRRRG